MHLTSGTEENGARDLHLSNSREAVWHARLYSKLSEPS
ncbi:hypothetical protein [Sporisorium scitamineum]|uniref:Uncharacterized protein n=1 Tax=Sporisorium scitamineum TaxID=49012 RepID=A0A0F7SDE7_9BASI|nr:hypothetical protein [Sporisorium scitamineum]